MNVFLLYSGSGPLVILTSHTAIDDPALLQRLEGKGIDKFMAWEIPYGLASQRYGGHFDVVLHDLGESDDLRVLDYNGGRAFRLFRFDELGPPHRHEPLPARQAA